MIKQTLEHWYRLHKLASMTFPYLLVVSFALLCYFVASTSIESVPRDFSFGFVKVLPGSYWVALGMALILFSLGWFSKNQTYLWVSALLLVVTVTSSEDLIHALPGDTTSVVAAGLISQRGFFSTTEHGELNFPGSAIVLAALAIVTNISSTAIVRAFDVFYNVITLAFSAYAFERLGLTKSQALVGGVIVVLSFYLEGVLIHTSLFGFLFYILIFGMSLSQSFNQKSFFLIMVLFAGMVVSHALSPFLTLGGLAGTYLGARFIKWFWKKREYTGTVAGESSQLFLSCLLIATLYWAYYAFVVLSWAVTGLTSVSIPVLLETAGGRVLTSSTPYASDYATFVRLYPPLLFAGFAVYLLSARDTRKLPLVLWIMGLSSIVFVGVSGYVVEIFPRIFAFAILPLSYGVARNLQSKRVRLRMVTATILIIALILYFPARYGQAPAYMVQESALNGSQFLALHSTTEAVYNSTQRELSQSFYIDIYRTQGGADSKMSDYFATSYQGDSWFLYFNGDKQLNNLLGHLKSTGYNKVFSNNRLDIYLGID